VQALKRWRQADRILSRDHYRRYTQVVASSFNGTNDDAIISGKTAGLEGPGMAMMTIDGPACRERRAAHRHRVDIRQHLSGLRLLADEVRLDGYGPPSP